jgi:hypothetical protein
MTAVPLRCLPFSCTMYELPSGLTARTSRRQLQKTATALIADTATEGGLDFSAKMRRIVVQAGETNRDRAGSPELEQCLAATEPAFGHAEHVAPHPQERSAAVVIDIKRCSVDLQRESYGCLFVARS